MEDRMKYNLAQVNIAKARAPMDDPIMQGFVEQLDSINAIADAAPGFVWRLQTYGMDNATALQPFENPRILINMSVWDSIESLRAYVYSGPHVQVLRDRAQWFEPMTGPILVLWWIKEGHVPTVDEAKERLALLAEKGPTIEAFTFKISFSPP